MNPIIIISGTNRPGAFALKIASRLGEHYKAAGISCEILDLATLPPEIFNGSSYAKKPEGFVPIQQRIVESAGLHVVTPEYNGSFPGVLKYFVDMLKFPESFDRKPVAFVGEAAGTWGGLRSVEQLTAIFAYRNAHIYPERVFIPGVQSRFGPEGKISDTDIDQRLAKQAGGFERFIKCLA